MNIANVLADELKIKPWQVDAVIELINEGNTIPFIARYRKEQHGSLDDETLRKLSERLTYLRKLDEERERILAAIEEMGKLTPSLAKALKEAATMVALEDLYRPFRPKRRTRAMIAREKGLEPLAELIMADHQKPLSEMAKAFISPEHEVFTAEDALTGAADIIAENVSDDPEVRTFIRQIAWREGILEAKAKNPGESSVYEMYYDFEEPVAKLAGHRILAINRGEKEKVLTVKLRVPEEKIAGFLGRRYLLKVSGERVSFIGNAISDGYKRLITPAVEREIRNALTEKAQEGAITVFGKNLSQLLLQPPIAGATVLGWDPGYRTGCKIAVVDPTGKVLDTTVVYATPPASAAKIEEAKNVIKRLIRKHKVNLISLGNGTACRESEAVIVDILKDFKGSCAYMITNEAGASVYSASALATKEFPGFDVGQRSAISMARRVQDPLAELVKIEPKAVGVGQYQHDMNQKKLEETLAGVVEDCVNKVGVDVNTASFSLLEYISGISSALAANIVAYRDANGSFKNRRELLKVAKLGPKAYEQCAGFLRIREGSEPLDYTGIHPESYAAAKALVKELKLDLSHPKAVKIDDRAALAEKLGIGLPTLEDILKELSAPGRDPREDMPKPILRQDVLEMKDLKEGMILKGTVRNVIDFGAFVDIGVHQDGLVHISRMTNKKFIRHPLEVVSIGDIVDVKVLQTDLKRSRISLTMILDE